LNVPCVCTNITECCSWCSLLPFAISITAWLACEQEIWFTLAEYPLFMQSGLHLVIVYYEVHADVVCEWLRQTPCSFRMYWLWEPPCWCLLCTW
jgi:hypothetical protein